MKEKYFENNEVFAALYSESVKYAFDQRFTPSPSGPRPLQAIISEKFAELIVRECAQFCEDKSSKLLGTMMKEHFGV